MRSKIVTLLLLLFAMSSCSMKPTEPGTIKMEEIIGNWGLGQPALPIGHSMVFNFKPDSTVSMFFRDGGRTGNWSVVKSPDKNAGSDAFSEIIVNYTHEDITGRIVLSVRKKKNRTYLTEGDSLFYGKSVK